MSKARDIADSTKTLDVDGGTIKLDGNYPVGTGNVALGDAALDSVASGGNNNVAIGNIACTALTTGSDNVALGAGSLATASTATYNTAVGMNSLGSATGSANTGVGRRSLRNTTSGQYNVGIGADALLSNTTGIDNTAVGYQAGYSNTTNSYNTYFGDHAGYSTTSTRNTFIGHGSGENITTGEKNTILGRFSGNTGGLDIRTASNHIVLSDGDGNPRLVINNSGILYSYATYSSTTANSANVYIAANGSFARSTSSLRYKSSVNDATHGLTELLALRPVTYKGNNDGDAVFGGLIAEEVHDAGLTEFVQYDDQGRPDALAYGQMVSLCIKAIQEQEATITALTDRITALENA